ncbi:MAG: hypothetical protein FVQ81_18260 [Candidatus Glassbacteria bacterium]|nr:hypothetical protein [Candidatus Glassbacteria bacterium]
MNDETEPTAPVDGEITVTVDHQGDIPDVEPSEIMDGISPGEAAGPTPLTPEQRHRASKAIVKHALRTVNVPIVYGVEYMTEKRVSHEAAFNDAEIETLAEAWAPLISIQNPLTVAVVTTLGVVGNKTVAVMRLNSERKESSEDESEDHRKEQRIERGPDEPITSTVSAEEPGGESYSGDGIANILPTE